MTKKLFSIISITGLVLLTTASFSFAYQKHINCGGNAYTAQNGDMYIADQGYSVENGAGYVDGNAASVSDPIEGTEDDPLYQSERWAVSEYKFDVSNGYYDVTVKFAETYFTEPDKRKFTVSLENDPVIEDLDIYAQVGHDVALEYIFTIEVTDGQLNITAQATKDCPKFSAISVVTTPAYYQKHINCGGDAYTAQNGDVYIADQEYSVENEAGYVDGDTASTTDPIDNTEDDILYQSNRFGVTEYKFDVADGFYNVTLKFAEIYFTEANQRVFNVYLEDQKVLSYLDIFSRAGHDTALDYQFTIKVADGQLNITADATSNSPLFSAISVIATSTYEKRINCGGDIYTALSGDIYLADQEYSTANGVGFIDGNQNTVSDPIDNTEDDTLYQSERWGVTEYKFDVPNGYYDVSLNFAENYYDEINKRVFSVWLEDDLVLEDIDIFGLAGHDTALDYQFTVNVTDGQLNITTSSDIGTSKFSAISVVTSSYYEKHINCGGDAYTAQNGDMYIADQEYSVENEAGYVDGEIGSSTDPIEDTEDDSLYQSERWGVTEYKFDVTDGFYEVTLKFAETYFTEPDRRRFNVWIEDGLVLENFDIYAQVGHDVALDYQFIVKVSDGQLNITTSSYVETPKFCAISVVTASTYEKRINCGGNGYTTLSGDVYIPDQEYSTTNGTGYVDGNAASVSDPIEDTEDDSLYQSERWGLTEYKFDVPDGFYDVKLKFAETYFTEANNRIFDVTLENHEVLKDFDIYALAGHDTALDKEFTVKVSDGQLNITTQATIDSSKVSAISIVSNHEVFSGYPSEILEDFDGQNKRVEYWWNSDAAAIYTRTFDNETYHDGFTSMKVVYDKLEGYPWSFFGLHLKNNIEDKDFSKFDKFAFWVYTDDPQLTIRVKFEDSLWRTWEEDFSSTTQGEWERFVYDFSEHGDLNLKDIRGVMFFAAPGEEEVSGTFYMDGLTIISSNAYIPLSTETPEITTPDDTEVYGEYSIEWTDESNDGDGATIYEIWEDTDPNFSNPRIYWRNSPSLDFLKRTDTGTYYYKVRAWTALPQDGGTSSDWSNTISATIIDGPPVISEVYSHIGSDFDNDYPVGSYVKVCLKEKYDAPDITSGTVRITSASQSYDSGIQDVTQSADGSYYFYHWDTNGLNSADDYIVAATLTDAIEQTDADGSDDDPDLIITLNLEEPVRYGSTSATDLFIRDRAGLPIVFTRYYHSDKWADSTIGYNWVHNYDMHLQEAEDGAVELWDEHGYWLFFTKNLDGSYNSHPGAGLILTKNPDDTFTLLQHYTLISYNFNTSGVLASITDRNGNQVTLTYEDGLLTTVTAPSGRQITFTYNEYSDIISITDFANRTFSYEYDTSGHLIKVTNPAGYETTYSYDGHNLTTITNPEGYHTYFTYVGDKLLSQTNDSNINYTSYTSAADPNRMIVTNARGYETTYIDEDTTHSSIVDALGNTTTMTMDDDGNVLSVTDANNNTWSYTWDENGNILTATDPEGNTITYTYEPNFNQIASKTDAKDNTVTYTYDVNGNLTDISNPSTHFTYDSYGQLISITDAENNTTTISCDDYGNITTITDAEDNATSIAYDTLGNPIAVTDAEGKITAYTYDTLNRLTQVTDALNNITQYEYNKNNSLTKIIDANSNIAAIYIYDEVERLIAINEQGKIIEYEYDLVGNLIDRTDANGQSTDYIYDGVDRLTKIAYPDMTEVNFTYDGVGNRLTMVDSNINVQWTYDKLNRITQLYCVTFDKSINYTYDEVSNRATMTDPDGGITNYVYNNLNRLTSLTNPLNQTTQFTYNGVGLPETITYANNLVASYTYDDAYRLTSLNNGLANYSYTYDNLGNRLTMTTSEGSHSYIYDDIYRLTSVTYPDATTTSYTYDPVGNRLTMTDSSGTINYSYDNANKLLSAGDVIYTYDNNGNLISKTEDIDVTTYNYDYENRLTNITYPNSTTSNYLYCPLGKRIGKTDTDGTTTYYFYDDANVITELNESAQTIARYTTSLAIDDIISMDRGGVTSFYHKDGLGSVTELSDISQVQVGSYSYDVFGSIRSQTGSVNNPYLFTGRRLDPEAGLYYYRARYYNSNIGRFISKDPILQRTSLATGCTACGFTDRNLILDLLNSPQNLHSYVYVTNNPVNLIDPLGLCEPCWKKRAKAFLKCMGEKLFAPSPPGIGVPETILSCTVCVGLLSTGVGVAPAAFPCGVCALNLGLDIYYIIECMKEAMNIPCDENDD